MQKSLSITPQNLINGQLDRRQLEGLFTVITLLAGVGAWLSNQAGFHPALVTTLYTLAYVAGGYFGLTTALQTLRQGTIDVDLLMIVAALGAAIIGQPAEGATLLFLFSLSNALQSYAMDRSRQAISKLMDLRPTDATVKRQGQWTNVDVEELITGDSVLVRPGERFPIDGEVVSGESYVDQATITGESAPVFKQAGDEVFASTVNGNGALEIRVTRLVQDTTLARIVQMVEEAQHRKANTQRRLDRFEQYYSIFVLGSATLLIAIPSLFLGQDFYATFYRGMIYLVVASPCALVISTPASILSAIANGARRGVLFKGGAHLEEVATLKVVAMDKTGTLTFGEPSLTNVVSCCNMDEAELLRIAAAAESSSEHHLAKAVVRAAEERGIAYPQIESFEAITGMGVEAELEGRHVLIGNRRLFEQRDIPIPDELASKIVGFEQEGQTVMLVYNGGEWLGLLGVEDTLRPNAAETIRQLKESGIQRVVMLTGDDERVAAHIAGHAGVDAYHGNLMPGEKVDIVRQLQEQYGPTAMIGDGVNDAPALAAADVGVAMGGAGTDVALETADVVLMADDLSHLPYTFGLAKQARRVVWQNLAFSIAVILALIAGTFLIDLPLPLGVVGHEGSTVIVVLNGMRLLAYRG